MDELWTSDIDAAPTQFSRRGFFKGGVSLGLLAGAAAMGADFWFDSGFAFADSATLGLPAGTAPEQVHLTWGDDPASQINVSWASPGQTPQPNPSIRYGTTPPSVANPGKTANVTSVSYQDPLNLETVHWYHASITGLTPGQTYYYQISDGASPASTFSGHFTMAPPAGRPSYVFTSFGDLATPANDLSAKLGGSGHNWNESSDNAYFAVGAVEAQQPLFHLLNGDLCYANLNTNNQPEVWRDFGLNLSRSAAFRPWMPTLGNHEIEFGLNGRNGTGPGIYNGPYGYGSYQTRFRLPDNHVPGYQGNFYSFQVGTVVFIALDADDVIYQDGGSYYAPNPDTGPLKATNPAVSIPEGSSTYNNQYTGTLVHGPDNSLVPGGRRRNAQTEWLRRELQSASNKRANGTVDMIVVFMHQCALSSSSTGNGSDLGIRQAWLPLFDQYGVDLVLSGHEHNYERSYAVRGYDPGNLGTVVAPNPAADGLPAQAPAGTPVFTRRPTVVPSAQTTVNGNPAFDTSKGTVFLVIGGGGTDGPTNVFGQDSATGLPQAKVITQRNVIYQVDANGKPAGGANGPAVGWKKAGADSVEDAPWSAVRDSADAYGYASFSVDPGDAPGDTTITMSYYHAPQTGSSSNQYVGTTTYTLLEEVVFGRNISGPPANLPELATPAAALGSAAAIGGGALYLSHRQRTTAAVLDGPPDEQD